MSLVIATGSTEMFFITTILVTNVIREKILRYKLENTLIISLILTSMATITRKLCLEEFPFGKISSDLGLMGQSMRSVTFLTKNHWRDAQD